MTKIGILTGAFNPLTRAHVALAEAARPMVDEIVCVIPRAYPHKAFEGATLDERREMLELAGVHDRVEITGSGLFIDIARELRRPETELHFICGADAAERVIGWNYGEAGAVDRMFEELSLLVAPRVRRFAAPERFRHRVRAIELAQGFEDVSSTEVRHRIAMGERWEHLVPASIVERVREIYRAA